MKSKILTAILCAVGIVGGVSTGGKTMCRWEGVSWGWVIGLEVRELGAGLWRAVEKRNVLQV